MKPIGKYLYTIYELVRCKRHEKLVMLCFFIIFTIFFSWNLASADNTFVTVYSEDNRISCNFRVEIAVTTEEHERGLMHRVILPSDAAMLFIFKEDDVRFFWMKNTYIPLDMIFINSKLEVTGIYKSAKPLDETIVTSWSPAMYVLEINSGMSDKCKITTGSKIEFKKK